MNWLSRLLRLDLRKSLHVHKARVDHLIQRRKEAESSHSKRSHIDGELVRARADQLRAEIEVRG